MIKKENGASKRKYPQHVFIASSVSCCKRITVSEIAYIEAMKDNCLLYMKDGKHHLLSCPMCDVEVDLDVEAFKRIHRSFIVNIDYIREFNFGSVVLENGKELTIGKLFRKAFKESLHFWGQRNRPKK